MNKSLRNNGYVNMGLDRILIKSSIIGIFDLDSITVQKQSRQYISLAQAKGEIVDMTTDLPISFVLCDGEEQAKQSLILSSFSLPTLYTHITRQFP